MHIITEKLRKKKQITKIMDRDIEIERPTDHHTQLIELLRAG